MAFDLRLGSGPAPPERSPLSDTTAPGLGLLLEHWLERLDDAGYRVGVRERLLVQAHLAQRAAAGQLPDDAKSTLAGVAPLLCTSPASQAQYGQLLERFMLDQTAGTPLARREARKAAARPQPGRWQAWAVLLAALALAGGLAWYGSRPAPAPAPSPVAPVAEQAPTVRPVAAAASAVGVYLVPQPLAVQPAKQMLPRWAAPLRNGLVGLAALVALALIWAAWQRLRREAVLAQARTPEAVDEHVLQAGKRVPLSPHPALSRSVVRALRQRVAGDTQVLDTAATLRATVRAAGALSPRYRSQSRTPEYLVLVDRRHPRDHATRHQLDVVAALADAGLNAQVWHFEGSPEHGCWPARAHGRQPPRTPFSELAARHVGLRLLVWGDAAALVDAGSGGPRPWARALPLLAEKAWLTPMPLNAWGAAEDEVDAQGFLLLPAQAGALPTLAGWLTSERAELSVPPGWPLAYPSMLRDEPVAWVGRAMAPPPAEFDELMFQLRSTLGTPRFQWLCGCAIFPALSPTLTLALGREALGIADDELVTGYTALACLPWFRHGRMPDWLRERLLDELASDHQAAVRGVIDSRLNQALKARPGDEMARVATERRRAWLRQAEGAAQDVLLARFLDETQASRLMQQLPKALQRALFRDGLALRGPRPAAWGLAALALLPGLWAASPWWPSFARSEPQPALAAVGPVVNPAAVRQLNGGDMLVFAPDGSLLVGNGRGLGGPNIQIWDARTGEATRLDNALVAPKAQTEAVHPLGTHRARVDAQGRVEVTDAQGRPVGEPITPVGSRARSLDFSPEGQRLAVRMEDHSLQVYGAPWGLRLEVVGCSNDASVEALLPDLVRQVTTGLRAGESVVAYSEAAWRTLRGRAPPPAGQLLFGPELQPQAERAAQLFAGKGIPALVKGIQRDDSLDQTIVLRLCDLPPVRYPPALPAIFGLGLAEITLIDARVAQLFSGGDAARRRAAADQLIRTPDTFSDAVPLALNRATALVQGEAPAGVDAPNGTYNALVLANAAWPATLAREVEAIKALAQGASRQGERTAQLLGQVLATGQRAASTRPRVYVQIASESQRALATQVVALLRRRGLDAPGIELMDVRRIPTLTELRAQGRSDRRLARETAQALATLLGTTPVVRGIDPDPKVNSDTYELWLDGGLCVTPNRRPAACGAPAAAPTRTATAAPAPAPAPTEALPTAGSTTMSPDVMPSPALRGTPIASVPAAAANVASVPQQQSSSERQRIQQQAPLPAPPSEIIAGLGVPVRIVVCSPLIRQNVAGELDAAAAAVEGIVRSYGYRTTRESIDVQANAFSLTRGRGLSASYTTVPVGPRLVALQLTANPALAALGFGAPQEDAALTTRLTTTGRTGNGEVVLTICGLPNPTGTRSFPK